MRAKFTSKNKYKIKLSSIFLILLLSIVFFSLFFLHTFNQKITPNLLTIASSSVNKLNETILMEYKVSDVYKSIDLNNVIEIVKNKNDEIISVDFNLENAYDALSLIATYLTDSLKNTELKKEILKYYEDDLNINNSTIVLTIPMGALSDGVYLSNLGPRIPVKISYVDYLTTSIRLKIEDYGINTVLASIYVDCNITNKYIIPSISEKISNSYSILLASKLIEGVVPDYYGGTIDKKSSILNVPIN
jgi:sporulation protein YunB